MSPQAASVEIDKLEESYWREFNDFQLQLRVHVDERDTTLNKACPPSTLWALIQRY